MHKLGAHLSVAGGYYKAVEKIHTIGGNCVQIFSSSPRSWGFIHPTDDQIKRFVDLKQELEIDPVYFHATYLINLANDFQSAFLSRKSLIDDLNLAPKMQVKGVIVHLGSLKGSTMPLYEGHDPYDNLIMNIREILDKTPSDTLFMIENAGNNKVGKGLEEIAHIIKAVNSPRVRVCLDTCHLYSAGYDLSTPTRLEHFLISFDTLIGLDKLEIWHFNDSRDPFNSGRDRHANIGQGTLSTEPFKLILNHPQLKQLPFIIETPGFDEKGPDKQNLDILKSLIEPNV